MAPGTQITPLEEVKNTLMKMGPTDFAPALPSHITLEKFVRVAQTAIQNKPDLLLATRPSLYNAIIKCAQDGLLPDGQEAALVKFGNDAVYMPMIAGVLKKVRNSGELATLDAQVVYQNDKYESWTDEKGPHFSHRKALTDRGQVILTYAYAITKDGATYFEEVNEEQMNAIKGIARSKDVWNGPFGNEMRRKSALHRLSKRLPMSTDLERTINRDEDIYDMPDHQDIAPAAPSTVSERAAGKVIDTTATPGAETAPVAPVAAPAPAAAPAGPAPVLYAEGVIEELKIKDFVNQTTKKAGKKFGAKIDGRWFGTFDEKMYQQIGHFADNKVLVKLEYTEQDGKDSKQQPIKYLNLVSIKAQSVEDLQAAGEEIPL